MLAAYGCGIARYQKQSTDGAIAALELFFSLKAYGSNGSPILVPSAFTSSSQEGEFKQGIERLPSFC